MKSFLFLFMILNLSTAIAQTKTTYWGDKVSVGNGYVQSYITMFNNRPKEIGVAISEAALQNLPVDDMQEFSLPMPNGVNVYPYKHMTIDWNPHGHEPTGVYDSPHFDFHFYFITAAEREAISCMDADLLICMQAPAPEYLVAYYAPTPAGVPMMGWHWVDLLSPEFNGGIFTRTYIYGYYAGVPIFVEPMVTLEYLQSKELSVKDIRLPQKFPYPNGFFPKSYKVYFDQSEQVHKVVLKEFQKQCPL